MRFPLRAPWLLSSCACLLWPWPAPFPSACLSPLCYCHQRMTVLLLFLKLSFHFRTAVKELILFECEVSPTGSCVRTLDTQQVALFGKLWNPRLEARLVVEGKNCRTQSLSCFQRHSGAGTAKFLLRASGVAGSVLGNLIMMVLAEGGKRLFFKIFSSPWMSIT